MCLEQQITNIFDQHWDAIYPRLSLLLNWPPCSSHEHQARISNVGSNRLKVDFVGVFNSGDRFTIEYQTGKANLDHAKAFVYPVLCRAKYGVWMARDFAPYVVKSATMLNDMRLGITFYLVRAIGEDENVQFELVREISG